MIEAEAIPLSPAARAWLGAQPDAAQAIGVLATGGDDYEILFCGGEDAGRAVAEASGLAVARIGRAEAGKGVRLLDAAGRAIPVGRAGYTHF